MERVHELVAAGTLNDEDISFWITFWHHIASAKVPLETKVAAYFALCQESININRARFIILYEMLRIDRAFVAELDLDKDTVDRYRVYIAWIDDDAAALARYYQKRSDHDRHKSLSYDISEKLIQIDAPRCTRFLLQDKAVRESVMREQMSPLAQRLVEEFVQSTDRLSRALLLMHGQSVKLIGMCVKDEALVEAWLKLGTVRTSWGLVCRRCVSVSFARKVHALATPDQRETIKAKVLGAIDKDTASDGCFELAWLLGLYPKGRECFLRNNVTSFPAFTFAMIVAMCDGYLALAEGLTETERRFFDFAARLPMDLQALVSLRLWGRASTVIQSDQFDRAFLTVI